MRLVVSQDTSRRWLDSAKTRSDSPFETLESKAAFALALEQLGRSRAREAMAKFEEALRIAPKNAEYLSYYGLCVAMEREDYESAAKLCERAIRIEPRNPIHRVNLGKVYRLSGCNERAHGQFIGAWEMDRSHPAPAAELSRMGIRRPPVVRCLPRSHWLNIQLGILRSKLERGMSRRLRVVGR